MNIAGREVPTPLVVGGGTLAAYLLYHWWKNRQAGTSASTTTATGNPAANGGQGPPGPRGRTGPAGPAGPIDCGPKPPQSKLRPGYHWQCTSQGWTQVTNTGCKGQKPPPKPGFTVVCAAGDKWIYVPVPKPKPGGAAPSVAHSGAATASASGAPLGKGPVRNAARPSGPVATAGAPTARAPMIQPRGGTHEGGAPAAHRANGTPAARPGGTNTMAYRDYRMPGPPNPPPPEQAPSQARKTRKAPARTPASTGKPK